jgi:prepilin-type N-terminal cleavage/methylation domain-containing protein
MKINILKNKEGFTIIEVLIVLAIAGLIMLVVLLAVPGLQRITVAYRLLLLILLLSIVIQVD